MWSSLVTGGDVLFSLKPFKDCLGVWDSVPQDVSHISGSEEGTQEASPGLHSLHSLGKLSKGT